MSGDEKLPENTMGFRPAPCDVCDQFATVQVI